MSDVFVHLFGYFINYWTVTCIMVLLNITFQNTYQDKYV